MINGKDPWRKDLRELLGSDGQGLAYLATPYTKYVSGIDKAFEDAARLAGVLLVAGVRVYSPIVHCHPIAIASGLDPHDHSIWLPFNELMLSLSRVLIVGQLPGWVESDGVTHEIKTFMRTRRPIFDLDPATFVMTRVAHVGDLR